MDKTTPNKDEVETLTEALNDFRDQFENDSGPNSKAIAFMMTALVAELDEWLFSNDD